MENKYEERRKRVMVGDLPDDFLRVSVKQDPIVSNSHPSTQPIPYQRSGNFLPSNIVGTLNVTVVQAQLNKNYGLTKMDTYVRIRIGHNLYETHADLRSGKHPAWNKMFQSHVPHGIRTIFLEIFDERAITPDERIAWGNFPLPEELFTGQCVDKWFPLSGRQGESKEGKINLLLAFTPTNVQASLPYATAPVMMVPTPFYSGLPYYSAGPPVPLQYPISNQQWPTNPAYTQVPQPVPCVPSSEDIKQLREMFPSFDKEAIVSVLESSGGNKNQAINTMLSIAGDK